MLELNRIQAITLDLDDTLWPVWPAIEKAEKALEHWLQTRAPKAAAIFANPPARLALRQSVERLQPALQHDLSLMRLHSIRLALQQSGENLALAESAFEVFFEARHQVTLYVDALESLQRLSRRCPLVALSNGNADIGRIGIGRYFRASISAQQAGVAKPDARIFQAAAQAAGCAPAHVLHVGDDMQLDVLGALNCGMQAAWLNRGELSWLHAQLPSETVTSLSQLCDLMRA